MSSLICARYVQHWRTVDVISLRSLRSVRRSSLFLAQLGLVSLLRSPLKAIPHLMLRRAGCLLSSLTTDFLLKRSGESLGLTRRPRTFSSSNLEPTLKLFYVDDFLTVRLPDVEAAIDNTKLDGTSISAVQRASLVRAVRTVAVLCGKRPTALGCMTDVDDHVSGG